MTRKVGFFIILLLISVGQVWSQQSASAAQIVCLADHSDVLISTQAFSQNKLKTGATSSLEVTYENFPTAAKAAFEYAASIWESILVSPQPIRIIASWESLPGNTLAYSGATQIFRNFSGAPYNDVWYVVALAEALGGRDLNGGDYDINITMNDNISWSYATDGSVFEGKFDLATVVLHEIAHGLGFSSSLKLDDTANEGQWGQSGYPYIYDLFVQNAQNVRLQDTNAFENPSDELKDELLSNEIYFRVSNTNFSDNPPKLHAPFNYKEGRSISHLDEDQYPAGTRYSLMSPTVNSSEALHKPGGIMLTMLHEMGWTVNNLNEFSVLAKEETLPVLIYPNPSSESVSVAIPSSLRSDSSQLELWSTSGQVLSTWQFDTVKQATPKIDISKLPSGSYLLKIISNQQLITKRLMKF
ncbi:T9SS type A sorting domain-containing protein [Jiulongibacter sp. NS-SX5]|uniref:T9SS type A sorting domain-containing protein n=1 Tax=Jiulongibacter sp. NS-SX5 TaxID=3463854 RepID=UPI0040587C24